MTQYIKKVNKIEAIQNEGNILTDVIPFLNEHGIAFEYTDSFIEGKRISVMLYKGEYTTLKVDDYLVINKDFISIMNAQEFESKYQEDDSVGRKHIDSEISTNITLDTTKAQRSFDLLGEAVERMKRDNGIHGLGLKSLSKPVMKQPRVRIEFDDIRDVPKVWVDGELIGDGRSNRPLVSLKVDWNTDTAVEGHKEFDINYLDLSDGSLQRKGFHQRTVI